MSIPALQITKTGLVAPASDKVVDGLWELFKEAFGQDLNTAMNTPQGQLVTSLAAIITDERNQMIMLLNQFDPRYASGIWQDALGQIYFMQRKRATHSSVELTLTGLAGVYIEKGTVFGDENKQQWQLINDCMIDANGTVTVQAQCIEAGQIHAMPDSINVISKAIAGLDRVTNKYAAVAGFDEESRNDFEQRRRSSVAINSKNTNAATYSAVANLHDVKDVYVVDNPTDITITVGTTNYSVTRNSIVVSVVGGDDETIAKTILDKAGSGCSFTGNTECIIADTDNFPDRPPTYSVKFLRPAFVPVFFQITVDDHDLLTYQASEAMKAAIVNEFTAKTGINQPVLASKFICAAASVLNDVNIVSLRISKDQKTWSDIIEIGIDEYPTTTAYQISII